MHISLWIRASVKLAAYQRKNHRCSTYACVDVLNYRFNLIFIAQLSCHDSFTLPITFSEELLLFLMPFCVHFVCVCLFFSVLYILFVCTCWTPFLFSVLSKKCCTIYERRIDYNAKWKKNEKKTTAMKIMFSFICKESWAGWCSAISWMRWSAHAHNHCTET